MKNSIGDVERYYAAKLRQAPHVISCYTAGARLIGLNERQLRQELRRMQKAAKNQDSPYAKPLPFVSMKKKGKKSRKVKKSQQTTQQQKGATDPQSQNKQKRVTKSSSAKEKEGSEQNDDDIKVSTIFCTIPWISSNKKL